MSTKLLVWNIQGFTLNKISAQRGDDIVYMPTSNNKRKQFQFSKQRLKYIISNVTKYNPTIFAVVEVISGHGPRGSLINSNGKSGCIKLLKKLRAIDTNWCLIPPLRMVNKVEIDEKDGYASLVHDKIYTEGVAVFYRSDELDFIGPYIWPQTDPNNFDVDTVAEPEGEGPAGPYPPEWQGCLPADNFFAGQFEFFNDKGHQIYFPALNSRNPFMVQFVEQRGEERAITLFVVHLPPNNGASMQAFGKLITYIQNYKIGGREVLLLAGDFNISNVNRYTDDIMKSAQLLALFNKNSDPNSTMNLIARAAKPERYLKPGAILDNIICRFGSPEIIGNISARIADRVQEGSLLMTPMKKIMAIKDKDERNEEFRLPLNFYYLGPAPGTSDHLALFGEI